MGLTMTEALEDYSMCMILQMMHARGVANGGDFDWVEAGEPDQELLDKFEEMINTPIDELFEQFTL